MLDNLLTGSGQRDNSPVLLHLLINELYSTREVIIISLANILLADKE